MPFHPRNNQPANIQTMAMPNPQADPYGFVRRLHAAEFHWFFVQGVSAINNGLIVPGASSILNGIEASLRFTIAQLENTDQSEAPSPYKVLSNNLLLAASDLGMPVQDLAFPSETDFKVKLASKKPNRVDVEIVRQRNNICHGNVFEYFNRDLGPDNLLFTPECLSDFADQLIVVANRWSDSLGRFRDSKGF
ncbi:MAG: hypothetical protein ACF8CQ_20895 [Rhodopirellula sp. JB044]|uniref:hypothetical protein n=1 Tax=Rhodopirellula sp. JB044 TaxID=3342844 RepID=UPI00370B91FD